LNLSELIRETGQRFRAARLFYGHGTDNPRDEAAWLVLRSLQLPFESALNVVVSPSAVRKVRLLAGKRIKHRIPVAYLLNEAWLSGHPFYVDERVIIPRSHIAELMQDRMKPWLGRPVRRVLDLCTGSGCLAILAALAFPKATVDASDLSAEALAVAAVNVKKYSLGRRVRLIRSDLFRSIDEGTYDLVISNPPYVASPAMRRLPREYLHEPRMSLAGGPDGNDLVKKIIEEAMPRLSVGGLLVCEIGDNRRALERAYRGEKFLWPETAAGSGHVFILQKGKMG
jgi:ribosomal protein L3 glutamine methyltransferase